MLDFYLFQAICYKYLFSASDFDLFCRGENLLARKFWMLCKIENREPNVIFSCIASTKSEFLAINWSISLWQTISMFLAGIFFSYFFSNPRKLLQVSIINFFS